MLVILFTSFGVMDMCHDILLLPARALLNDVLPSEQVNLGNACFSLMTSFGACLGLSFILIPLERIPPLSYMFDEPIRATFVVSFVLLNASHIITLFMALKLNAEQRKRENEKDSLDYFRIAEQDTRYTSYQQAEGDTDPHHHGNNRSSLHQNA